MRSHSRYRAALLVTLFLVAGVMTATSSRAEPERFVTIKKKIVPADGQSVFPTWMVGKTGSFAITVTNSTSLSFALVSGEYVIEEHIPAGLTVTSIGGGDVWGSREDEAVRAPGGGRSTSVQARPAPLRPQLSISGTVVLARTPCVKRRWREI